MIKFKNSEFSRDFSDKKSFKSKRRDLYGI